MWANKRSSLLPSLPKAAPSTKTKQKKAKTKQSWLKHAEQGDQVWIKDKNDVYSTRTFVEYDVEKGMVLLKKEDGDNEWLDMMTDVQMANRDVSSDMTSLHHINEATVIHNLEERSKLQGKEKQRVAMYTYISNVLIAVNPFDPTLKDPPLTDFFKGDDRRPHPFGIAETAYRQLQMTWANKTGTTNQSIVLTGDSGAGKTVSSRILLKHLTHRSTSATSDAANLDQRLLESNPILETFGNAKTLRNNNSSRFGKYIKLQYTRDEYQLAGGFVENYLLEKSRVVHQIKDERNFHIFYQMLYGLSAEKRKEFNITGIWEDYAILKKSGSNKAGHIDDKKWFGELCHAFDVIGIDAKAQNVLFQLMCAMLKLGNVEFNDRDTEAGDVAELAGAEAKQALDEAAMNLYIDEDVLLQVICQRVVETPEGVTVVHKDAKMSRFTRNAIIKELYNRLFDWLVFTINNSLGRVTEALPYIGVLDIFGFEFFSVNDLEQLLINFTNEVLQATFNQQVFIAESEVYRSEGIQVPNVAFPDNAECVTLIRGKPNGVLPLLDTICESPGPSDIKFNSHIHQNHKFDPFCPKPHPKYVRECFIIKHFASNVTYTVGNFIDKNDNNVPKQLEDLFANCLMKNLPNVDAVLRKVDPSKKRQRPKSVTYLFTRQMEKLVTLLNETRCSFVKCIKPNATQTPGEFDRSFVSEQLRCQGIMQTCEVLKVCYPTRIPYAAFVEVYQEGLPAAIMGHRTFKKATHQLFVMALMWSFETPVDAYKCGRTKIFFRSGKLALLEKVMNVDWSQMVGDKTMEQWLTARMLKFIIRHRWRKALAYVQLCQVYNEHVQSIYAVIYARKVVSATLIQKNVRGLLGRIAYQRRWETDQERKKREADDAKKRVLEAQRRAAEEEAALKLAQAEAARKLAEAETARKKAEKDESEKAKMLAFSLETEAKVAEDREKALVKAKEEAEERQRQEQEEMRRRQEERDRAFAERRKMQENMKKRQAEALKNLPASAAMKDLLRFEELLLDACKASGIKMPHGGGLELMKKEDQRKYRAEMSERQRGKFMLRTMDVSQDQLVERFDSGQRVGFGVDVQAISEARNRRDLIVGEAESGDISSLVMSMGVAPRTQRGRMLLKVNQLLQSEMITVEMAAMYQQQIIDAEDDNQGPFPSLPDLPTDGREGEGAQATDTTDTTSPEFLAEQAQKKSGGRKGSSHKNSSGGGETDGRKKSTVLSQVSGKKLEVIFATYSETKTTKFGDQRYMTQVKFEMMAKDCNLMNSKLNPSAVALTFTKYMVARKREMRFQGFDQAFRKMAIMRQIPYQELVEIAAYHHENTSHRMLGVTKEGFLTKRAISGSNWKRRWMVLDQHILHWYKAEGDMQENMKVIKGSTVLTKDTTLEILDETWQERNQEHLEGGFNFSINLPDRPIFLRADGAQERDDWMEAIAKDLEKMNKHLSTDVMVLHPQIGVGWVKEFAVLEDKVLTFFLSSHNRNEHGMDGLVQLTYDTVVEADVQPDPTSTVQFCFEVRAPQKTCFICATNQEHFDLWVNTLRETIAAMAGYQDDGAEREYEVWFDKGALGLIIVETTVKVVHPGGEADRRGVRVNSLILSVNGVKPSSNEQLNMLFATAPRPCCVRLRRPRTDGDDDPQVARFSIAQLRCDNCGAMNNTLRGNVCKCGVELYSVVGIREDESHPEYLEAGEEDAGDDGARASAAPVCPHKEGYLITKTDGWKKRWFVLKDFKLQMSRSKEAAVHNNVIKQTALTFDTAFEVAQNPEGRAKVKNCFRLVTPMETIYMISSGEEAMNEWLAALEAAVGIIPKGRAVLQSLHSSAANSEDGGKKNEQFLLKGGWLSMSVHGSMKGFVQDSTKGHTDYNILVSWGPDKNYNEAWVIGKRWPEYKTLQQSTKRRLMGINSSIKVPNFPQSLQVMSKSVSVMKSSAKNKIARGRFRQDKLQSYFNELLGLLAKNPEWADQLPEFDEFFEFTHRLPLIKRRRAMMEEESASFAGQSVYPMNEDELKQAGVVIQQTWRLLKQSQIDVRHMDAVQQLLCTALGMLPRLRESARVGPFTEMELLPYAQQYLQDYQTTFGIYNDMGLMYLIKWLQERYDQIQGLSEQT